ncbi:MAG: hypothetical protein IAB81_02715 [Bacteroidetes bacterium]|uniref:Uncharacterized protein n=1 Tax=Candidatus Merdivivens pullicola TaxID=2840872 RepID=A0A9D9IHZ3_9BACT|nr:hypothetical protein [Candidatus Merdivivens pullicola]
MTHRDIQKAAAASADLFCEVTDCYDEYEVGRHVGYTKGFVDGDQWRIDSVWHKPNEQPKRNRVYLAQMGEEAFDTFYDSNNWESFSKGLNITRWAYIEDLLPEDNK